MRTTVPFLLIFAAALLVNATDSAQSQVNPFGGQAFGLGVQSPPCGRGTQRNRFVLFDNGTNVCDNTSGLVWERTPVNAIRTFQQAVAYCSAKGPGWNVPGIKDFFTLVDYANIDPPLPSGNPFVLPANSSYWSVTPRAGEQNFVWDFSMHQGATGEAGILADLGDYVWCVRY